MNSAFSVNPSMAISRNVHKKSFGLTCEATKHKAQKLAKSHIMWHEFKASTDWCLYDAQEQVLFWQRTSLCQKSTADYKQLVAFQQHVIRLCKINTYIHSMDP
jgi:hypothetical protein